MNKTQITYDKPIYLGFCVLDLSKSHMYNFHYDYMKKKYGINAKPLHMDTDSLTYHIFTHDFYNDIKGDLYDFFDTSDFEVNNQYNIPLVNKKTIGFFKDENNGKLFKDYVGLRSKMYAMNIEDRTIKKCKGVNIAVTNNLDRKSVV